MHRAQGGTEAMAEENLLHLALGKSNEGKLQGAKEPQQELDIGEIPVDGRPLWVDEKDDRKMTGSRGAAKI